MKKDMNDAPIKRNDDIEIEITALSSEGQGIGRYDGFTVFVPYALPGERISAHVIKVNKGYAIAKMTERHNDAECRVTPICECFYQCGGCDLQHIDYDCQLEFKRTRVLDALTHVAGLTILPEQVERTIGASSTQRYRNKASIPFSGDNGSIRGGFFAIRSHRLIPISDCIIQKKEAIAVMQAVCIWANRHEISAYDDESGKGHLRHIVVRTNESGDVLAVIVTNGELKKQKQLVSLLRENVPGLVGIISNINDTRTNVILGERYDTIWGASSIDEEICGASFMVSAQSFLQVNHEQTERLYEIAVDKLELSGTELIYDVYSGIGTITMLIAKRARSVIGIESVPEAVENARENAARNGVTNATFITGEAERVLPKEVGAGNVIDGILIDPPRKGCEPEVLRAIADSGAKRVVYVSCNPQTLARDVKLLTEYGYSLISAQPVDMFPYSCHVETVVLMSKVR